MAWRSWLHVGERLVRRPLAILANNAVYRSGRLGLRRPSLAPLPRPTIRAEQWSTLRRSGRIDPAVPSKGQQRAFYDKVTD